MSAAAVPAPAPDEKPQSLWKQRNFIRMWVGQAVSMQGDGLQGIAMSWWIMEALGSASSALLVQLAGFLPGIFLAPLAGAVVDRSDRRRLMMTADTLGGLITGVIAWAMFTGRLNLLWVIVTSVLMATARSVHGPAVQASVPQLVPPTLLNKANSLNQMAQASAQIIAPVAGGVLVAALGTGMAVSVNSFSFFVAALTLLWVTIPRVEGGEGQQRSSIWREMGDGFRYLRQDPMLFFMLVSFALINFALTPMGPLMPFLATGRLGLGSGGYGTMVIALPMGALLGSSLMSRFGHRIRRGMGVIWGIAGIGVSIVLFASARSLPQAMAGLFLIGIAMAVANISSAGIFQTRVPQAMQGRVFAFRGAMAQMASPLGLLLASVLARSVPAYLILLGGGILAAAGGLACYLVPGLSRAE